MAETIKVFLQITVNDELVRGMPIVLEQSVDEIQEFGPYEEAADANDSTFSQIPNGEIGTIGFLLFRGIDKAEGLRLEGGESGNTAIRLSADSLVLIARCSITNTAATVNNNSGATAKNSGLVGGT